MEKISRIIASSPRTRAVDVTNSQPVRPGAPAMGRPVGRVTPRISEDTMDRLSLQNDSLLEDRGVPMAVDAVKNENLTTYNSKGSLSKAKIVDDMAKKFFLSTPKEIARDSDESLAEQTQSRLEDAESISN